MAEKLTIQFSATGGRALKKTIEDLHLANIKLTKGQKAFVRAQKKATAEQSNYNKAGLLSVKNMRIQAGAFATLRSKLLLFSFAVSLVTMGMKRMFDSFIEQEKAEKKLETALGKTSSALLHQASALQQVTTFGDEAIIGVQALIGSFTKDEEAISAATKATLDLAAAKGMDLNSAADLVSKTLGSSTNSLSRYGIEVEGTAGSTARLNSLTKNIADLFGGQARAQAETLGGAMQQMTNAFGDASEAIGNVLAPIMIRIAKFFKAAAESVGDFFSRITEDDLDTTIRQLEELGVAPEKLKNLKEFQLKEDLQEINSEIENMQISYKSAAEAEKELGQIEFSTATEVVNKELDKRTEKQEYLNAILRAEEALANKTAETKIVNGEQFVKLVDEEGKFLGKVNVHMLDQIKATAQQAVEHMKNGVILNSSLGTVEKIVDKNKEDITTIKTQLTLLKEKERIEKEIALLLEQGKDAEDGFFNQFLDFVENISPGLLEISEKFAQTFGEMGDIAIQSANARIEATNKAANIEIESLKKTRRFQKLSSTQQAKEEQKIRDKAEKDNAKRRKEANRFKAAEFRINQTIKIRETIMATQKAFMDAAENPFLQALIVAQGAAAVGVIAAQKPPKMEQGGIIAGRRHSQGGTMIEAEAGEFVVSRQGVDSVGIETLNRINQGGGSSNVNIVFEGNVLSEDFIVDEAIPKIKEALRRGEDIGIS